MSDTAANKLEIRTVHHLSGAGGTLISKALAAQPDAIVLSEVAPILPPVRFYPFDPVSQYINQTRSGEQRVEMASQVFADRIRFLVGQSEIDGKTLIVRDHAHSDFLRAAAAPRSSLLSLIRSRDWHHLAAVTTRHPVDSWLSFVENRWNRHVKTFEVYCERQVLFLRAFAGIPTFKYEEIVDNPSEAVEALCQALDLRYSAVWQSRWSAIKLTGDSGRSGTHISRRPRRPMSPEDAAAMAASAAYKELCQMSGYREDFAREAVEVAQAILRKAPEDKGAIESLNCYTRIADETP